jgi:large subunit ribosomal protein L19
VQVDNFVHGEVWRAVKIGLRARRIKLLLPSLSTTTGFDFMSIISNIQQEQMKKDVAKFNVGDSVRVHTIVKEGEKERVQIFTGIVIARKGTLLNQTVTVRRISYGEGVERVFPIHSPRIAKIEVETAGTARRAKLNYLRNRKGKSAMAVREKTQTA